MFDKPTKKIKIKSKVFLLILDGYGHRHELKGNAVKLAKTPYLDELFPEPPQATLSASGRSVGLPKGLMGNSEVGHLNLGAGRIVYQDITRIDKSIENGEFFQNPVLIKSIEYAKKNGKAWHLIGLVSDGGVHSSLEHLYALLEMAKQQDLKRVYLHALMDGRDTSPYEGVHFIWQVEQRMHNIGAGKIASICGRYWGMDRDRRWERIEHAYRMLTAGEGIKFPSAVEAVEDSYHRDVTDEFIEPSIITNNGKPLATINDGDAVMFFNFRSDRAREITWALIDEKFEHFPRKKLNLHYTTMTEYHADLTLPIAFMPQRLEKILGEVISSAGLKQFRTAESEKYAHVTYFFNGGIEAPLPNEDRLLVASPNVATYDLQPEMSAPGVAKYALENLDENYAFFLLNFANPDMVGHTGVLEAAIKALETLDPLVKQMIEKAQRNGYAVLMTADHGNCEQMIDDEDRPHTAHTTNRVPLALLMPDGSRPALRQNGILADIAPTLLELLGIEQPDEMTGKSLILAN